MSNAHQLVDIGQALSERFVRLHSLLEELESHDHDRRMHAELSVIRRVFDASGEAMFALDLIGTVVQCNAHAIRLLGCGVDEVKGRSLSSFLSGGDDSCAWATIQTCLRRAGSSAEPVDLPADLVRPSVPYLISCRISLSTVRFDDGDPIVSAVVRPRL